jgi:hypothetical protein
VIDSKPLLAAMAVCDNGTFVKPDDKPNRIWLAQGEEEQPRSKIQSNLVQKWLV